MTIRKTKVIKLIFDNPGLSGNELYKQARKEGYGINKSDFYQTLRTVRKLPEPTIEEKRQATPIKYRKPLPKLVKEIKDLPVVKKRGAYGIVLIEAKDNKGEVREFWIKYETKKSIREQIEKLKKRHKSSKFIKIKKITFKGFGSYTTFIDQEFKKLLDSVGIDL